MHKNRGNSGIPKITSISVYSFMDLILSAVSSSFGRNFFAAAYHIICFFSKILVGVMKQLWDKYPFYIIAFVAVVIILLCFMICCCGKCCLGCLGFKKRGIEKDSFASKYQSYLDRHDYDKPLFSRAQHYTMV